MAFHCLPSVLFTPQLGIAGSFQFLGPDSFGFGSRGLLLAGLLLPGFGQGEGFVLLTFNVPLVRKEEPEEECRHRNVDETLV